MFMDAKTVLISLKETRMQSRIVAATTKVEQNQTNLKVAVRFSRNVDAVSASRSEK